MAVASASWQVELDLFRGPLPTLLDLIERRELPVTRISLVQVADQFLALVRRAAQRAIERAAARRQARTAAPSPLIPFTDVLHAVLARLRGHRHTRFRDLVAEADDLIVAITMFLAVLELVRRRRLTMRQQEAFGTIELIIEESPHAESGGNV